MAVNARWRFNPFTALTSDVLIEDEPHQVQLIDELGIYGIYANEGVLQENPSSVVIVEDVTGALPFTEVPRGVAPNSGQYRVDYDAETFYNTGLIQFNSADVGKQVLLTYKGTGTITHPTFRIDRTFNYAGKVTAEDNIESDVDLVAGQDVDSGRDVNVARNLNVDGDAVIGDSSGGALSVNGNIDAPTGDITDLNVLNDLIVDNDVQIGDSSGGNLSVNGNIDLSGTLKQSGTAILGYLDDNTPIFGKWLSGSFGSGDTQAFIAHGLTNAYTNKRILGVTVHIDFTTGMFQPSASSQSIPAYSSYDNTNIGIVRIATGTAYNAYAFIIYK